MKYLLLTSAIPEELQGLEFLQDRIFSWNGTSLKVSLLPLGIGSVECVVKLSAWLLQNRHLMDKDLEIVFIGSCGSYDENYPEFLYSRKFLQVDITVLEEQAKYIGKKELEITRTGSFSRALVEYLKLPAGIINTTNSVTVRKVETGRFFDFIDIPWKNEKIYENLEVYGIARFCNHFRLPFTAIFSVTNHVYEKGSVEWKENYMYLSKKLNGFIKKHFEEILD